MPNVFEGIQGVLFDLDGTLVETNIDFSAMRAAALDLGRRYGVEAPVVDILGIIGYITDELERQSRFEEAARVKRESEEIFLQIEIPACQKAEVVPGALELLDALRRAGIKIGIVTRNHREAIAHSLSRTGVRADVVVARDDVANAKPHPDHLLLALAKIGVAPENAVMVGDYWMDVKGGRAAGTRTVGFLRPGRAVDLFDEWKPDLLIHDLRKLTDLVNRLRK